MLPNRGVSWLNFSLPRLGGELFVAPDCPRGLAAQAIKHSTILPEEVPYERLGQQDQAAFGRAYKISNFVMKTTAMRQHPQTTTLTGDLHNLRANIALHEGLKRIEQPIPRFRRPYYLQAPELYAAFIPHISLEQATEQASLGEATDETPQAVWMMSLAPGTRPLHREMPPEKLMRLRDEEALLACRIPNPEDFLFYYAADNMRVMQDSRRTVVTQFDILSVYPLAIPEV